MKSIFPILTVGALMSSLLFTSCQKESNSPQISQSYKTPQSEVNDKIVETPSNEIIDGEYIVTLADQYNPASILGDLAGYDVKLTTLYSAIQKDILNLPGMEDVELLNLYTTVFNGFAAQLTKEQVAILQDLDIVKLIEPNQTFSLDATQEKGKGLENAKAQSIPYGIARVGKANGQGKRAWVLDTGVDLDHPDLNINTSLSKDFSGVGCGILSILFGCDNEEGSPEDGHGHGTHVSGTIAALDNNIGVVGVAYGAEIVALKVLTDAGSGATSGIIQGIDYAAANFNNGDVANMSLGGGVSTSLDNAVISAANKGLMFALAAGNDSQNSNNSSPARANGANIYTVSAMDSGDRFASFSNFSNPPIDFCAPGVSTKSTYKNGGYATLSGTSMASPHVTGILLIKGGKPSTSGFVKNDPDGSPDPIAHL